MVLVNGVKGIGTGQRTFTPAYNPRDIINNLKGMMNGAGAQKMSPWYRGFKGKIEEVREIGEDDRPSCKYITTGVVNNVNDTSTYIIDELPLGGWTKFHKMFLDSKIEWGTTMNGKSPKDPFIKVILCIS